MRDVRPVALVGLLVWAAVGLAPLVWMVVGSLADEAWLLSDRPLTALEPGALSLESYRSLLRHGRILTWTLNSLAVAGTVTVLQILAAAGLGWVLAKHPRVPGRPALLLALAVAMAIPGQVLLVPLFRMVAGLGLLDTLAGVVLPGLVTPFSVLLMYERMKELPEELVDAARIDGCTDLGIFWRVALPLALPQAGTLAVFAFLGQWNAFLWPLLTLLGSDRYTLPVGLATLQGQHEVEYGLLLAGATVAALPAILVFVISTRLINQASLAGGLKG